MVNKPLVIYHGNCVDGFSAAWCFWHRFKNAFEYMPANYGVNNILNLDVKDRTVYMVDFSYPKDLMLALIEEAALITVIDHHKTAWENLATIRDKRFNLYYDVNRSGAMLAWDYLNGMTDATKPELLAYVQDRDLWTKKLPFVDQVAMALFAYDYDFRIYDDLMLKKTTEELITEGEAIFRKFNKDLEELLKQVVRMFHIGGYDVPVANLPYTFASEGATRLAKGFPFAATYYDTDTHRVFSLRSTPEGMDVSQIATKYNGGGHRNASGFKVPRNHVLSTY